MAISKSKKLVEKIQIKSKEQRGRLIQKRSMTPPCWGTPHPVSPHVDSYASQLTACCSRRGLLPPFRRPWTEQGSSHLVDMGEAQNGD